MQQLNSPARKLLHLAAKTLGAYNFLINYPIVYVFIMWTDNDKQNKISFILLQNLKSQLREAEGHD